MGLHPYLKYVFWREVPLGIIVELVTREPNFTLKLLNVYRPYLDRKVFWHNYRSGHKFYNIPYRNLEGKINIGFPRGLFCTYF